jgi:hypothetical protein
MGRAADVLECAVEVGDMQQALNGGETFAIDTWRAILRCYRVEDKFVLVG